jgi:hypothetical protein
MRLVALWANVEVVDKALSPQLANARSAMLRVRMNSGVKGLSKAPGVNNAADTRLYLACSHLIGGESLLLCIAVMRELLDVVDQAEQLPLSIDFLAAAERESIESFVVADVAEDGFHCGESLAIARATGGGVDAFPHAVGV